MALTASKNDATSIVVFRPMASHSHAPRNGPNMQPMNGNCVKGTGNYYGAGMPGAGPRAVWGYVRSGGVPSSFIWVYFSGPIQIACGVGPPWGNFVTSDGRDLQVDSFVILPPPDFDTLQLELTDPVNGLGIQPGDDVYWRYDDADSCLIDRDNSDPLISQGPLPIRNDLVLEGDFIILETGGTDIMLVEEDTGDTDGVQVEEAP